jgi:hypothetical protein
MSDMLDASGAFHDVSGNSVQCEGRNGSSQDYVGTELGTEGLLYTGLQEPIGALVKHGEWMCAAGIHCMMEEE